MIKRRAECCLSIHPQICVCQPHPPGSPHPPSWILLKRGDEPRGRDGIPRRKQQDFSDAQLHQEKKNREELGPMRTLLWEGKGKRGVNAESVLRQVSKTSGRGLPKEEVGVGSQEAERDNHCFYIALSWSVYL